MTRPLVLGSRGSDLALWQSRHVAAGLDVPTELKIISTQGDRVLDRDLSGMGGKGFFTKEIEEALLAHEIDLAVHSLKDLPTTPPDGLSIAAIGERAPVADLLLVHPDWHDPTRPFPVKPGGMVGASSLRRQACVRAAFPEGQPASLRGNVPTRVRKCAEGQYAAIVLAEAGLSRLRLDFGALAVYRLDPSQWLPAPGQGALGIETRASDPAEQVVRRLDHLPTRREVEAERGLLAVFEGGCHLPLGAWANVTPDGVRLRACFAPEPERLVAAEVTATTGAEAVARTHAELVRLASAGARFTFEGATLCRRLTGWS
jgi:hydroxymethylbilane synthase